MPLPPQIDEPMTLLLPFDALLQGLMRCCRAKPVKTGHIGQPPIQCSPLRSTVLHFAPQSTYFAKNEEPRNPVCTGQSPAGRVEGKLPQAPLVNSARGQIRQPEMRRSARSRAEGPAYGEMTTDRHSDWQ